MSPNATLGNAISTITSAVLAGNFTRARNSARQVWKMAGVQAPVPAHDDLALWLTAIRLLTAILHSREDEAQRIRSGWAR